MVVHRSSLSPSSSAAGRNNASRELSNGPIFHGGHTRYSAMPTNNFLLTGPWSILSTDVATLSPWTQTLYGGTDVVTTFIMPVVMYSAILQVRRLRFRFPFWSSSSSWHRDWWTSTCACVYACDGDKKDIVIMNE